MTLSTLPSLPISADTAASLARGDKDLAALRQNAWSAFSILPWPKNEDEAWRRTDISGLELDRFTLAEAPDAALGAVPPAFTDSVPEGEAVLLWAEYGIFRRLPEELAERGVIFTTLAEAVKSHPSLVLPHLGKVSPASMGKFEALSLSHWNQGYFLYVPKGVDVGVPFRAGFSSVLADGRAAAGRSLIVAEAGARLTLTEVHASSETPGAEALSVGGTEIVVGENAEVTYLHVQRHDRGTHHFFSQNARLAANARLATLVIGLGGKITKSNFGSELLGTGSTSRLYGLVFGDQDQSFTHHTWQDHRAPDTTSDLLFKSALLDESKSVFTGIIRLEKIAQRSNAYQASKNILLSGKARANAIPMLEILADDVKCGHGAAVGNLDDDQRFYLMSRGMDRAEAERLIVEGFFADVLERVAVPGLPDRLRAAIDRKLKGASHG